MAEIPQGLITVETFRERLARGGWSVCTKTVWRWCRRGDVLDARKTGDGWLIRASEVERMLAEGFGRSA